MAKLKYFDSFEAKEEEFRRLVHSLLPRKYVGLSVFFKDFGGIMNGKFVSPDNTISYISSNPRDCLPYTFVGDLLVATYMMLSGRSCGVVIENVIDQFKLAELIDRKIHSLSGGEIVRLALARSYIMAPIATKAIFSSPFTWLSKNNYYLFDHVEKFYKTYDKEIDVLAMDGEYDLGGCDILSCKEMTSLIRVKSLTIALEAKGIGAEDHEDGENVIVDDYEGFVKSPCLLMGENGCGKSLLAKVLSKSIDFDGLAQLRTNGVVSRGRLIFQDVIIQAMMRPFSVLLGGIEDDLRSEIISIYSEILDKMIALYRDKYGCDFEVGCLDVREKTLIQYKIMLVSIRVGGKASALILDEPDWGLSKKATISFVSSVVDVCHNRNITVLVISHKDWWDKIVNSKLLIEKYKEDALDCKFKIKITEYI
jgi:energy-coupling factor transporter ATP-binding protein EcfA2